MSYRNKAMYDNARDNVEPELIEVLKRNGFTDIVQSDTEEDRKHIDIFVTINGIVCKFDAKDLENDKTSPNYCVSNHMYNDIVEKQNEHSDKYRYHYLACKQYVNGTANGKFIVVPTLAIFPMMIKKTGFWLAPVYKYMKTSDKFRILG